MQLQVCRNYIVAYVLYLHTCILSIWSSVFINVANVVNLTLFHLSPHLATYDGIQGLWSLARILSSALWANALMIATRKSLIANVLRCLMHHHHRVLMPPWLAPASKFLFEQRSISSSINFTIFLAAQVLMIRNTMTTVHRQALSVAWRTTPVRSAWTTQINVLITALLGPNEVQ